jgi:mannose-1-phosphate guanylyltransferase
MSKKNTYCVIMAGGIGSRFWPMSRSSFPKQFHDFLGTGRTLIQMTYERFLPICDKSNILVVTSAAYLDLVKEQLPDIPEKNILLEPSRKNTAPCLAYAMFKIVARNPNASMIVAPADHLVLKPDDFVKTIKIALKKADSGDYLVTLGIKPSRPDTGYGYIQFSEEFEGKDTQVRKVRTFTEKPELNIAEEFIQSGDFYWNSGIFIWTAEAVSHALEKHASELFSQFKEKAEAFDTSKETEAIQEIYNTCPNISIDYAIMEKAKNTYVVLSDFGWSDLGTWGSLYTHLPVNTSRNVEIGKRIYMEDSKGCLVKAHKNKLVAIQGLKDYIVVDTEDVLLICKMKDEQKIKQLVNRIKLNKGDKFL